MPQLEDLATPIPHERGLFCNRTLNLRSIRAIGYDMDYTLVHYDTVAWEQRAYEHLRRRLAAAGYPTDDLTFDHSFVERGLILDIELGNMVKANRFGFIKRACHGTQMMSYEKQRNVYERTIVDLSEPRWVFLNTLFSISEACMFLQLIDRLDGGDVENAMGLGYTDLYRKVRQSLDAAHTEGELKADILAEPDSYVVLDEETPKALLDQKRAGKKLLLITNSEWSYTEAMMSYAFDRFLPGNMTWQGLFELIIVGARKPVFFEAPNPAFEVVPGSGLLKPVVGKLQPNHAYWGGHAGLIEKCLDVSGDQILYVGDHIYGDVHVSKDLLRWRTALIVREIEEEVKATSERRPRTAEIAELMRKKEELEHFFSRVRLELTRARDPECPEPSAHSDKELSAKMAALREELVQLDAQIAPLARAEGTVFNRHWGPIMRAGNDKSHFTRQVERSADIYTSRVSNFLLHTPFVYLRSPRGSIPHDEQVLSSGPVAAETEA